MKFASKRSSVLECDDAVDDVSSVPCDFGRGEAAWREGPETGCETDEKLPGALNRRNTWHTGRLSTHLSVDGQAR